MHIFTCDGSSLGRFVLPETIFKKIVMEDEWFHFLLGQRRRCYRGDITSTDIARVLDFVETRNPEFWRSFLPAKILMALSASIILTLGVVHLVYTFSGPMLTPRDPALQISMSQTSPVITKKTTMWRCWIGFNATHSMGLILFGLVFGFFALAHGQMLFRSPFLLAVGLAMLGGYVVLCKVSFFSWPRGGVSISLACYFTSIVLSRGL